MLTRLLAALVAALILIGLVYFLWHERAQAPTQAPAEATQQG